MLKELQTAFLNELTEPGTSNLLAKLVPGPGPDRQHMLSIYQDAYRLRLRDVLADNFDRLALWLGDDDFREMAFRYIAAHPSSYRNVRWYGDQLPTFLRTTDPYRQNPALADLAAFEWTLTLVFDGPDDSQKDIGDLALIPPEAWGGLKFRMHRVRQLASFSTNVIPIFNALTESQDLPEIHHWPEGQSILFWRHFDGRTLFRTLEPDELWMFHQAEAGVDFAALCEGLTRFGDPDQAAFRAATILQSWIVDGLIAQLWVAD